MITKIVNNRKLTYLECRHVSRVACSCYEHINFTFNILIITSGRMKIHISNKTYTLREKSILIINPFEPHRCEEILEPVEYYVLAINYKWLQTILDNLHEKDAIFPMSNIHVIQNEDMAKRLNDLSVNLIEKKDKIIKIHHKLNLLIIELIEYGTFKKTTKTHQVKAIKKILHFITMQYKNKITIENMATELNMTPQKLRMLFRNTFSLSPYQFITSFRLLKAKKMLLQNKSISYISKEVGFYDQSHFQKLFKKHFDITPKEYIRHQTYS